MKSIVKYMVVIVLAIVLLYGYNTSVPKNFLTFIIGLPIYVGILLWVVSLFEKRQSVS